MGRFGLTEILILLALAALLFGGSRLAGIGKGLGDGIRNFKKGLKDDDDEAEAAKLPKGSESATSEKVSEKAAAEKT